MYFIISHDAKSDNGKFCGLPGSPMHDEKECSTHLWASEKKGQISIVWFLSMNFLLL